MYIAVWYNKVTVSNEGAFFVKKIKVMGLVTLLLVVIMALIVGFLHYLPSEIIRQNSKNIYEKQKKKLTPLEMAAYYTDIDFSKKGELISYQFSPDYTDKNDAGMNSEALTARIRVPKAEIDKLFSPLYRQDDMAKLPRVFEDVSKENVTCYVAFYQSIEQNGTQGTRYIVCAVEKPLDGYCTVNIRIDGLGWHLVGKEDLGGFDTKVVTIHTKEQADRAVQQKSVQIGDQIYFDWDGDGKIDENARITTMKDDSIFYERVGVTKKEKALILKESTYAYAVTKK